MQELRTSFVEVVVVVVAAAAAVAPVAVFVVVGVADVADVVGDVVDIVVGVVGVVDALWAPSSFLSSIRLGRRRRLHSHSWSLPQSLCLTGLTITLAIVKLSLTQGLTSGAFGTEMAFGLTSLFFSPSLFSFSPSLPSFGFLLGLFRIFGLYGFPSLFVRPFLCWRILLPLGPWEHLGRSYQSWLPLSCLETAFGSYSW